MSHRAICATSAGHTLHATLSRTWYQPGRINRAYQRTNLTELSGGFYRAGDSHNQISGETMSEIMELVVIEKKNAMAVFTNNDQLDPLIEAIEKEARSLVPDVTTKKGRDAIASMAHKVARSKTYIDNAGKDLVAELKALPKQIDESRRVVRERLDALKDEVRRPLTEWEAEQARIAAEKAAEEERMRIEAEQKAALEALRKQVEVDHEMALLMNDAFDREQAEKKAEAERQRIAREEEIKRLAEEKAKREAAEQAQREIDAAAAREREAILAKERAEREQREAAERAEREKQAAVEAERRKAQEEADRIRREAEQREQARLAEEKRKADEQARREADVKHRKAVGTEIVKALLANTSLTRDQAIEVLTAIKDGNIPHTGISY
jgi:DNA repair exonuclease SbcCD ATPase subunit